MGARTEGRHSRGGEDLKSLWASFVPRHVAREIADHPHQDPVAREHRFEAVALFADVSGFTAMSEALGRAGRAGDEELTTILNRYFGSMIELSESYGGDIATLGGDGLAVLFRVTKKSRSETVARAVQCALGMQTKMADYRSIHTAVGSFSLAMKAGLAMGGIMSTSVGDPAIRLEHVVAGRALDRCAVAESLAAPGEVMVDDELLDHLADVETGARAHGYSVVRAVGQQQAPALPAWIGVPDDAAKTLVRYLHPLIAQRLRDGYSGLVNEHRSVTVLFANFAGWDYDNDSAASAHLKSYFSAVIRLVDRYEGYLAEIEMGDKGDKYIVLFGAPLAHENDDERAFHCALELKDLVDVPTRMGINRGRAYCGQIGGETRHAYRVIGDTVNVAARLMQAADFGQILVSHSADRKLADAFSAQPLDPVTVKGKVQPIPVFALRSHDRLAATSSREPRPPFPIVGRETELERIRHRIDLALEGRGQIIAISGEAGIGKSRLAAEITSNAGSRGFAVHRGGFVSFGRASYAAWQEIWRSFFDLRPSWPAPQQIAHVEHQLASIDSGLAGRVPLLAPVIDVQIPDNDVTSSLDPQLRLDSLKSLLLECLRHQLRTTPVLLVLDDVHWIDPLSQELLEFIGRNLTDLPLAVMILHRPMSGDHNVTDHMARYGHSVELELSTLTRAEAEEVVRSRFERLATASGDVSSDLVDRIIAEAGGNPFYMEELVNYVYDRGVDPRDPDALDALELPDSLNTLVIARIDQLPEGEKTTLKVASVLGRTFKASWLSGSYPEAGPADVVDDHLKRLDRLELITLQADGPDLEYGFKHALTQEVAYDSLTFATRELLHERVGQFIERTYPEEIAQRVEALAHHYGRSSNSSKQMSYLRQAGDSAKADYANDVAIDYYQRLIVLLPPPQQSPILVRLGDVWQLTGRWPDAEDAYRRALEVAASDRERADCERALGFLLGCAESYDEALTCLERARQRYMALGDRSGIEQTLECLTHTYVEKGDFRRALECAEKQMESATARRDQVGICSASESLGRILLDRGEHRAAVEHLQKALDVAVDIGQQITVVAASSDIAGAYASLGHYAKAVARLQGALDAATKIGYQRAAGMIIGNAGRLYLKVGDHARAAACLAHELRLLTELGNWRGVLNSIGDVALLFEAEGRHGEAEELFDRAVRLGRALDAPYFLSEILYQQAYLFARQRRYETANALNDEALAIAAQLEVEDVEFRARLLSLRLRAALDPADDAVVSELEGMLERCSKEDELAAVHYELWRLDEERESSREAAGALYGALYARMPDVTYRRRHEELTGRYLGEPASLPPLPEMVRDGEELQGVLGRSLELIETVLSPSLRAA